MQFIHNCPMPSDVRSGIAQSYRADEKDIIQYLLSEAQLEDEKLARIKQQATQLVEYVRKHRLESSGIDAFLNQYSLSSEEGVAMMCLAEALLRVPDKETIDELIKDKLSGPNWSSYSGQSHSLFVNATT